MNSTSDEVRELILREIGNLRSDIGNFRADFNKMTNDVAEVRQIVAGSSASVQALSQNLIDLRTELGQMRKTNHDRFDKIHEMFQEDEEALEHVRLRITVVEKNLSFVYKLFAVLGTISIAITGIFSSDIIQRLFGK